MIKSSTGQKTSIIPTQYYTPSSYSCKDLAYESLEHTSLPQKPRGKEHNKNKRGKGKDLGPWQEHVVGNDPTRRNHGRAAGGGDPATDAGPVLERGRERERDDVGELTNGYGGVRTPLPVLIPTRL